MRFFLCLIFLIPLDICANFPHWALKQIESDFSLFSHLTPQVVAQTERDIRAEMGGDTLHHIKQRGTQLICVQGDAKSEKECETLRILLRPLLIKLQTLPPFLVTFSSSFERPLLRRHAKVPIFAYSKRASNKQVILVPLTLNPLPHLPSISWRDKEAALFWCGKPIEPTDYYSWSFHPRAKLVLLQESLYPYVTAHFIPALLSSNFTQTLSELELFGPASSPFEQAHYRFLIALSGHGAAHSLSWKLASSSCVLIQENAFIQWFSAGLNPYEHYIPIEEELEDLKERLTWLMSEESLAERVGMRGREFSELYLNFDFMIAYWEEVLTRYKSCFAQP